MRSVRRCFAVTIVTYAFLLALSPAFAEDITLLDEGGFHGDDMPEIHERPWVGMYVREGKYTLENVEVTISPWFDQIMDTNENDKASWTGKEVKASASTESHSAIVLMQLPKTPEKFVTAFPGAHTVMPDTLGYFGPKHSITITMGEREYRLNSNFTEDKCGLTLQLYSSPQDEAVDEQLLVEKIPENVDWDNIDKIPHDFGACNKIDGYPILLWAGDMDDDGKLDLLLKSNYHYNVDNISLYLSSKATGRNMVKRVGHFSSTGC